MKTRLTNIYLHTSLLNSGICCGYGEGSVVVTVEETPVLTTGEFGSSKSVSFGSCQGSTSPTTSPTSSPTLSPTDSEGCSDWYFVQNNGNTRDCSWIGSKPDKRCNRNGGFGECIVGTKCYNNPIYIETPLCPRTRARDACTTECDGY